MVGFHFLLDDVFYTLLVLVFVAAIIALILKKLRIKEFLLLIMNSLAALFILFYWLWGFNYFREGLNTRLSIAENPADKNEFLEVLQQLVQEVNENYILVAEINKDEIEQVVETSYEKNAAFLNIDYPNGKRRPKKITYGDFFAKATILGYYGPFFNEVHINGYLHNLQYSLTLAHEKAHQFGITSEAEANFYAWLVCSTSEHPIVSYSASLFILRYFAYQSGNLEEAGEILKEIRLEVKQDYNRIKKHWQQLRSEKIDHAASKVNDAYLKANRVEKGIKDYSGVVKYVMDFYGQQTTNNKQGTKN